ncbi:MAG: hypothetical protein ABI664_00520 [bacterium]
MLETRLWADPRGAYAILALLSLALVGAAIAPGGLRRRRGRGTRVLAATLLVGASLALVWPRLMARPALDVHPVVPGVAQLAGTWSDGPDTLDLRANGDYRCQGVRCTGFGRVGTWTRQPDGTLIAQWSDGHRVPWNLVMYHGRYRLALLPPTGEEPSWEGRLMFEKAAP